MRRLYVAPLLFSLVAGQMGGPCDIYAFSNTPCVAAHSLVRALYSTYDGPLYSVQRSSDNATLDISLVSPGGYVNATAQDSFCGSPSPGKSLPEVGAQVLLRPYSQPKLSFRHCSAQGFVTPDDGEDHFFKVVSALSGATNALSFQSVNFPTYYLSSMSSDPNRIGIVSAPSPADASWMASSDPGGKGFFLTLPSRGGAAMTMGDNLTGDCAGNYRPPSASVYLAPPGAASLWVSESTSPACTIVKIFDQSPQGNHLFPGPPGGAVPRPDKPVGASDFPISVGGGLLAYGAYFRGGMGYRRDNTTGIAKGNEEETIYMVVRGDVFNDGCCCASPQ